MTASHPPSRRPVIGILAFASLASGFAACVLVATVVLAPGAIGLPLDPVLFVLGLGALAFGLREVSVRAQFAQQADRLAASLRDLKDKNRLLNLTERDAEVGHWRLDFASDTFEFSYGSAKVFGTKPGASPSIDTVLAAIHPDDAGDVAEAFEAARLGGASCRLGARVLRPDGSVRHISLRGNVELGSEARTQSLFGFVRDRTDDEEMQRDLRRITEEARAQARAKGLFLARMSHEIRTPMNGVLGFAELLGRSELAAEQRRQVDFIVESGKSLQTLLNDILDLSKIEAGKVAINPGTVDIHHLVYRVTQMAEPVAREKAIKCGFDIDRDVPRHVVTDALRLRQILSNLLSNAMRFTDEGGVSISLRCVEGRLRFAVCDTGTGISQGMQESIFDAFTQERTHATNTRGGTGLGLAISRQLAELMGGTLGVRSEVGEGSVFTLTLPLVGASAPPLADTGEPASTPVRAAQGSSRVLLAEDYDINRELILAMAAQLKVELHCAEDGVEAVSMVRHARECGSPYALVLMDLQMPRLDGLEAARELRASGIAEDELPIVALTANAFADDVENCLAAGMQAHLAKPLSLERLSEALAKWMPAEGRASAAGPGAEIPALARK